MRFVEKTTNLNFHQNRRMFRGRATTITVNMRRHGCRSLKIIGEGWQRISERWEGTYW